MQIWYIKYKVKTGLGHWFSITVHDQKHNTVFMPVNHAMNLLLIMSLVACNYVVTAIGIIMVFAQ